MKNTFTYFYHSIESEEAARRGDTATLSKMLLDNQGWVGKAWAKDALLAACRTGNVRTVHWMRTESPVQLDQRQLSEGLKAACEGRHSEVVRELLKEPLTDPNVVIPDVYRQQTDETNDWLEVAQVILADRRLILGKLQKQEVLVRACRANSVSFAEAVTSLGAPICTREGAGRAVEYAKKSPNRLMLKWLIDNFAKLGTLYDPNDWLTSDGAKNLRREIEWVVIDECMGKAQTHHEPTDSKLNATKWVASSQPFDTNPCLKAGLIAASYSGNIEALAYLLPQVNLNAAVGDARTLFYAFDSVGHRLVKRLEKKQQPDGLVGMGCLKLALVLAHQNNQSGTVRMLTAAMEEQTKV